MLTKEAEGAMLKSMLITHMGCFSFPSLTLLPASRHTCSLLFSHIYLTSDLLLVAVVSAWLYILKIKGLTQEKMMCETELPCLAFECFDRKARSLGRVMKKEACEARLRSHSCYHC